MGREGCGAEQRPSGRPRRTKGPIAKRSRARSLRRGAVFYAELTGLRAGAEASLRAGLGSAGRKQLAAHRCRAPARERESSCRAAELASSAAARQGAAQQR